MAKRSKIKITVRAVIQRINRKLKSNDLVLKIARTEQARKSYGQYYVVGENYLAQRNVGLEWIAKDLGVLRDWEEIADE